MKTNSHKALFLHMGPGLHGLIEEQWLQNRQRPILFWSQPPCQTFSELVSATQNKIQRLSEEAQGPIRIFAHSFGGLLATACLPEVFARVSECHFFSTGFHYHQNFRNLLSVRSTSPEVATDLQEKFRQFLEENQQMSRENFPSLIGLLAEDAQYINSYWQNQEKKERYLNLAAQFPGFDFESFFKVSMSLFDHSFKTPSSYQGKINVFLGQKDPLLNVSAEQTAWKSLFSQANIEIFQDQGHMLHLEKEDLFLRLLDK